MNGIDEEQLMERRLTDKVKTWTAILGPILGIAFGVGIYKASTQGKLEEIPKLEIRVTALEKDANDGRAQVEVVTTRFTEQISSINNRMGRMEDLLEKTFYSVSEIPKESKRK